MITRHEVKPDAQDIWAKLAADLPASAIQWRQDGRASQRDGKWFARFVAYIDAQFVRERLDSVVPGEWDLTLDIMPQGADPDGEVEVAFKARLSVLGVKRECVGTGKDYKSAASDAFKRAAVRFGIGHELYAFEQNWVQVESDSKFAKPVEDPQAAYERRHGKPAARQEGEQRRPPQASAASTPRAPSTAAATPAPTAAPSPAPSSTPSSDEPSCPKCGARMWDNRVGKKNPKAPDFKCRDRSCDGAIWPPKEAKQPAFVPSSNAGPLVSDDELPPPIDDVDELPF